MKNTARKIYVQAAQAAKESAIDEVARFLSMSVKAVDLTMMEDGFAHRNPQLLAVFMQTALLDYHSRRFTRMLEHISHQLGAGGIKEELMNISTSLKDVAERIRSTTY